VALALCVTGLATSLLLLVRAATGTSACGLSGGCDVVQSSSWSHVLGVPLAAWGAAYFAAMGVLVARPRPRWSAWLRGGGLAGGLAGTALLLMQLLVLRALCPWCICVDVAALGLGALAIFAPALTGPHVRRRPAALVGGAAVAGLVPLLLVELAVSTPASAPALADSPQRLAEMTAAEADGVAKIVEFVDVECPFCREQHARLAAVVSDLGADNVEVQVHHVPLPQHAHARPAAEIVCCSEALGRGPAVLDALMVADDLGVEACRTAAIAAGVDPSALDTCLRSDAPTERLAQDHAAAVAIGVRALPTCVIGGKRFDGLQTAETLRDAVRAAITDAETPCET